MFCTSIEFDNIYFSSVTEYRKKSNETKQQLNVMLKIFIRFHYISIFFNSGRKRSRDLRSEETLFEVSKKKNVYPVKIFLMKIGNAMKICHVMFK